MLQDELADGGFQVVAVAIDEDADKIRPFTEGVAYPVLLDADHVVTELYAISNVPTVVLIDADDTIVQPNWNAYATDTFMLGPGRRARPARLDHPPRHAPVARP